MNDADLVQRSPEWLIARTGSLGASQIRDALARLKGGDRTKTALDLMYEIAAERLTHRASRQVNARQWGIDTEPQGRESYSFVTNLPVIEVGLIPHPTIANAHASPDGLVGDEGGLEIKCPTSGTHLRTLVEGVVPVEHLPQIHWSMACSGRLWWDFVSFDPRMPADLMMFVRRVERDEAAIARMEDEARVFLAELEDKLKALEARYEQP